MEQKEKKTKEPKEKYKLVKEIGNKRIYEHITYVEVETPIIEHLVTEDDTPVDNIYSEKQQRLLIDPLHVNEWTNREFLASSNVAIYYVMTKQAVVPHMFLSFNVKAPEEWFEKKNRSYFMWEIGKPPEMVVEIISNKTGKEADEKMKIYAQLGILYYVFIDPYFNIFPEFLKVFKLVENKYIPFTDTHFYMPEIRLGIRVKEGEYEQYKAPWARLCDEEGIILKTGIEKSRELKRITKIEKQRAEQERQRAE